MVSDEPARPSRSDAARLLLAAARERFAVAAADLLLPETLRLTEWQRLTASRLRDRLVSGIEEQLRARLAAAFTDAEALSAALASGRIEIALPILERGNGLDDPELMALLVRRVEEHRFWQAQRPERDGGLLHTLAGDADPALAADFMDLVIARSRRFDRFEDPTLGAADLPAELQHRLIWTVAAAIRHYVVQHHRLAGADAAIAEAATALAAEYDEEQGFEALSMKLAHRLNQAGRLDDGTLVAAAEGGLLPMLLSALAVRSTLDAAAVWEILSDPRGHGPALLLRAAGVARDESARILFALAARGPGFSESDSEGAAETLEIFDMIDAATAGATLRLWRAPAAYRAAVARLSTRARSVAGRAA